MRASSSSFVHVLDIHLFICECPAQMTVESEFGGGTDGFREWDPNVPQEVSQGDMVFVDLAVGAFGLLQRSVQNLLG